MGNLHFIIELELIILGFLISYQGILSRNSLCWYSHTYKKSTVRYNPKLGLLLLTMTPWICLPSCFEFQDLGNICSKLGMCIFIAWSIVLNKLINIFNKIYLGTKEIEFWPAGSHSTCLQQPGSGQSHTRCQELGLSCAHQQKEAMSCVFTKSHKDLHCQKAGVRSWSWKSNSGLLLRIAGISQLD